MLLSALVFVGLLGLQIAVTPRGFAGLVSSVTHPKGVEVIRKHTRRAAKAAFAISLGVAIVIGLFAAAFARPAHSAGTTVVLGTKNFGEEYILGQLYKQALEAKGFSVTYKENIGSTELIQTSLTSGKINMYPEYTGVIVQDVFHRTSPKTAAATYSLAKQLEGAKGFTVLKADSLLRHRSGRGHERDGEEVRPEGDQRSEEGRQRQVRRLPGVQDAEHVSAGVQEGLRADERRRSFRSPESRPMRRSTPARCWPRTCSRPIRRSRKPSKYTVLSDPKHVTGFQNVAPIVKTSVATALGSKFTSTVNAVSAKLTQNAIIAMNKAVTSTSSLRRRSRRHS